MVYVPSRETIPPPTVPIGSNPVELRINRQNTIAFIEQDPIDLRLSFSQTVKSAGGGRTRGVAQQRSQQRFKLIMQSPAGGSLDAANGEDGEQAKATYVLLGRHDAEIAVGDWWNDSQGNRWEVTSLIPTNGYEMRANVTAYGESGQLTGG